MTPKHGYVLGQINYFTPNFPWADVMKRGAGMNFRDGGVNNDIYGWPTIPPGLSATAGIHFGAGAYGWFPPGDYKAFTSVTQLDVSVEAADGLTQTGTGPGWCTFTVADLGESGWAGFNLKVRVHNPSGSTTYALSRAAPLQVCKVAHLALVAANADADHPDYITNFGTARAFRATEHFQQNSSNEVQGNRVLFSDYGPQDVNCATYAETTAQIGVYVRRARRLGAMPWVNVGNALMVSAMNYTVSDHRWHWVSYDGVTPKTNRFVDGDPIYFLGGDPALMTGVSPSTTLMYARDCTSSSLNLALSPGGPALSWGYDILWYHSGITDLNFGSFYKYTDTRYADMFLPFAQECFANDPHPELPIPVEWTNEPWNDGYAITTPLRLLVSKQAKNDFNYTGGEGSVGYVYGSMQMRKAFEDAGYAPDNVIVMFNWFTGVLDQWKNFKAGLDTLDVHSLFGDPTKTFGDIIRANPQRYRFCVAPYINGNDPGYAHTSPGGFNMQTAIDMNGGSTTFTDAFWDSVYERSMRDNRINMQLIKASVDQHLPGVKIVFYEWGQQIFASNPGGSDPAQMTAAAVSLNAYLSGEGWKRTLKRAFSECAIAAGVDFVCHYSAEGGWSRGVSSSFSHWGIRDRNVDTAASSWWRTK